MENQLSNPEFHSSSRREVSCMKLRDWYEVFRALAERQEGQTMAEYGVVLSLITLAVVAILGTLGLAISGKLSNVVSALNPASGG